MRWPRCTESLLRGPKGIAFIEPYFLDLDLIACCGQDRVRVRTMLGMHSGLLFGPSKVALRIFFRRRL